MRRPVGLDINGWRDFGCRDWSVDDLAAPPGETISLDGGIRSVAVAHDDLLVGGPQAILSPIGRGGGWSDIGEPSKRRALADHWSALVAGTTGAHFDGDVLAAARALSLLADQRVVCMPDHAGMGEAQQKRLLAALSGAREPRPLLLWRSVALVLGVLESGCLQHAAAGMRIACLIQGPDGIERQILVLRHLVGHPEVLAPERAGPGDVCCPRLGFVDLLARATAAVDRENPVLRDTGTETPRMAGDLLFREAPLLGEEIVRRNNGNWLMLRTPQGFELPDLAEAIAEISVDADCVVLLSPLADRHRGRLGEGLTGGESGRQVHIANPDSAARGALVAARRIELGIPHYFDRLDQISLAVSRRDGPVFEDLIPASATAPGNREYVSDPITNLVWPEGKAEVNFYIRKGAMEIRHWITSPVEAPRRPERLEVRLRQMPAQGWAKLAITSPSWETLRRAPIQLDWGSLPIDPRTEAEILASLERPRPVVPQRVHFPADIGFWNGTLRGFGILAILQTFDIENPDSIRALARSIGASSRVTLNGIGGAPFQTVYPVGTDGELPAGLSEDARRDFDGVINSIARHLMQAIVRPDVTLDDNEALRCLSWIFARCPRDVQDEMVAALDVIPSGSRDHPLLKPRQSARVVVHGLGRVVTDPELLRTLIPKLYSDIDRPNFLAALSSLLSRPQATPALLSDIDVDMIAELSVRGLRELRRARNFGINFKYFLIVVAGLLRVRERDPWALLADDSKSAHLLIEELKTISEHIRISPHKIRNEQQKLLFISELILFLVGEGGSPDILTALENLDA